MKNILLLLLLAALPLAALEIAPDDPRLHYSGILSKTFVEGARRNHVMKFSRLMPHRDHLEHDNPGARIRFRTDSRNIRVKLRYNGLHLPEVPLDSTGIFLVDGDWKPEYTFTLPADRRKRTRYFSRDVSFRIPSDGAMHTFDVILPSGDSVDFLGISVNDRAKFADPKPFAKRAVLYGDLAGSSEILPVHQSFSYLLGHSLNWEIIDAVMADTLLTPNHAEFLALPKPDILIVMTGSFDRKFGTSIPVFKKNLERFTETFRTAAPNTKIVFVTPLEKSAAPYTAAIREFGKKQKIRVIEGAHLLPDSPRYYSRNRVTPNAEGAALLAENLAKLLQH